MVIFFYSISIKTVPPSVIYILNSYARKRLWQSNHRDLRLEQSNLVIRIFLVTLKLFLNAKRSLSLWSKLTIGHRKWFLNTNFVPYQNVPLSPSLTVLLLPSQFLSDIGTYCWFSSLKPYRTNPIMHDNDRKPHNFYLAMLKTWSLRLLPPTSLQTFW